MAADNFDNSASNESASSMIGKAKKNVFKNLLNFWDSQRLISKF